MYIQMEIQNIKSINSFKFNLPLTAGLYALTGENATGKSTILACAATSFYNPLMYSYFGAPIDGSRIKFEYNGKHRAVNSYRGRWNDAKGHLGIIGFYEGSLIYGNRFKDVDFPTLKTLASVKKHELVPASRFVSENLGTILRDDISSYKELFLLSTHATSIYKLLKRPYYYQVNGRLVNQLTMSTGENLLISILHSLEKRISVRSYNNTPTLILLDEIELALHSSALRRLIYFLEGLAKKYNLAVLFSTHSIELIRSINPENIFYLQRYADSTLEVINPCYPVYATRNLESSTSGHDYIIMVEDTLAKSIVDRILYEKNLLDNKRILVIAVGGWSQVLRFASDTIRSNLTLSTTQILIILDRDIKDEVLGFMKSEKIGFSNPPNYLPIKSLEKYLLDKLVHRVDHKLLRRLNDYIFQNKSLVDIINKYQSNVNNGVYADRGKIKSGKYFYCELQNELRTIRKTDIDVSSIVVNYLFQEGNDEIEELSEFLGNTLSNSKPLVSC